jgi:hypothetical protein
MQLCGLKRADGDAPRCFLLLLLLYRRHHPES